MAKNKSLYRKAKLFHRDSSFGYFEQKASSQLEKDIGEADDVPEKLKKHNLAEVLCKRSSVRQFKKSPLSYEHLKNILWAGYGRITSHPEWERRTVPSAGSIFPINFCVYIQNVEDLKSGFYSVSNNQTLQWLEGPVNDISSFFLTTNIDYKNASAIIFIIGDFESICSKYGERGYRYLLIEAGHVAQNICLAASALNIGSITIGGFDDESVNKLLFSQTEDHFCLYALALGNKTNNG